MKKSIEKILILLIVVSILFTVVGINVSFAAEGSISAPSTVKVGENFTVTVIIPQEAILYEGKISVTYSDGTGQTSGKQAVITGVPGTNTPDYTHPGNMSYTFNALTEGKATISVTGLKIASVAGKINQNDTLTQEITVESNKSAEPETPSTPTTPSEPPSTPETPSTSNEPTWTNTGDTVYALEDLNVRSGWGTSYDKIGTLSKDSSTKRIAVGSNGWDKIEYNGVTAYVMSKYLTTQNPADEENDEPENNEPEPTWTETGDTVYALETLNVRSGWGTYFESIGMLKKKSSTKRIAVGSNGWDKIEYDGEIAYVKSKYLTTEEPEEDEVANETNEVQNTNVVENSIDYGAAYNTLVEEVGVIPPVGKNVVDYIYVVAVCLSIGMVAFIGIKIRENNKE